MRAAAGSVWLGNDAVRDAAAPAVSRLELTAKPERPRSVVLLMALLVGGCLGRPLPPPTPRPQTMCHASGGGYVPCNFGYHGSQGP